MSIGRRIHRARKKAKLTLTAFAAQVGVAKSSACAWEKGRHGPKLGHLRRVAQVLEIDLATLIGKTP